MIELKAEERTKCEVWTRCMGYHRPVDCWNRGKQQEHRDRRQFRMNPVFTRRKSCSSGE